MEVGRGVLWVGVGGGREWGESVRGAMGGWVGGGVGMHGVILA